jgi:hypothetical protein
MAREAIAELFDLFRDLDELWPEVGDGVKG